MARINIEDSIYRDKRFVDLCFKLGSLDAAIGALVRAWSLAQTFYLKDDRAIPRAVWDTQGISEALIEVGLADEENGRIRVSGADEQFKWLLQKSEAGRRGGSKGKRSLTDDNERLTEQSGSKPLPLTLTLSPTLPLSPSSSSDSSSKKETKKKSSAAPRATAASTELNRLIWESYRLSYHARYGKDPVRNASVNGQISQLGKRLGVDAVDVIAFFLRHNDGFYLKKTHSLGLCLHDAESLHTQWVRNRPVTGSVVRQYEQSQQHSNLLEMIDKGEL